MNHYIVTQDLQEDTIYFLDDQAFYSFFYRLGDDLKLEFKMLIILRSGGACSTEKPSYCLSLVGFFFFYKRQPEL